MPTRIVLILLALGLLVFLSCQSEGELIHRWSFNDPSGDAPTGTIIKPLAGDAPATVRGQGAKFTGSELTIPGTTAGNKSDSEISAYIDLPNRIISSRKDLTLEIWGRILSAGFWTRLFDFGRSNEAGDGKGEPGEWTGTADARVSSRTISNDHLFVAIRNAETIEAQRLAARLDGGREIVADSKLPTIQYSLSLCRNRD